MTDTPIPEADHNRLEHFPITFFASVMGLAGLTLALHAAESALHLPDWTTQAALAVTVIGFLLISLVYLLKAVKYPDAVKAEWNHPVKLAFFPAISISILLIATATRPVSMDAARMLWIAGTTLQAVLTLSVISNWIGHRPFQHLHISPAWFIPAVGNVVVPVAGVSLGFPEISWLFFAGGVLFWMILLTLVMNRLIFHDPLPGRLAPTVVILIAPPAIAFLSWVQLNGGHIDGLARFFYYVTLVFAAIVALEARAFAKLPFAMSWWALSFPVAGLTIASLRFAALSGVAGTRLIGFAALALLVVIILGLVYRTLVAILRGQICQPE